MLFYVFLHRVLRSLYFNSIFGKLIGDEDLSTKMSRSHVWSNYKQMKLNKIDITTQRVYEHSTSQYHIHDIWLCFKW